MTPSVVEICAGAGGQALGLEHAGFHHELALELDHNAAETMRYNRPTWDVRIGDVADQKLWNPDDYAGIDLLAGGVPCPPFSMAGKQLGAADERDLFAWSIELAARIRPRALLLENVRGLSMPRFAAYRQRVKDRLNTLGYWSDWRLLEARNFGVPQLRPRFVLVALQNAYAPHFEWPVATSTPPTVGQALYDLMGENSWPGVDLWAASASQIAPTIVGGSKKHGGADLGPTRAKEAWRKIGVDAKGVADEAPRSDQAVDHIPRLTTDMVARLQGWDNEIYRWKFTGRKTTRYRQIGNAFPPPVAHALGTAIAAGLNRTNSATNAVFGNHEQQAHDPLYIALSNATKPHTRAELLHAAGLTMDIHSFEMNIQRLAQDFEISISGSKQTPLFELRSFRGFIGQDDHQRHRAFESRAKRSRIS